jgi:hypothetical protein
LLLLLELTKSTNMWRRCSGIFSSQMSNHPQLLACYTILMITFTSPMPYPIVLPKHRKPGFHAGAARQKSAQILVDYYTVSPDTSCVLLLHDPDLTLTGGAKTGRPNKSSPMRVMTNNFNIQVVEK